VFEVQDEIARAIADTLKIRLTGSSEAVVVSPGTRDVEAYDLYLKGRYLVNRRILRDAIAPFEEAIRRDPNFVAAHTALAEAYAIMGFYSGIDTRDAFARSRAAAGRARELDPDSADVHLVLGIIEHYYGWDFAREERELKRAAEKNPRIAGPHAWLALVVGFTGRLEEALASGRRATELEPLSANARACLGWPYYAARRYDDALREFRHGVHIDPAALFSLWSLGVTHRVRGEFAEAIEILEKVVAEDGGQSHSLAMLGNACAGAGDAGRAREILAGLEERASKEYVAPLYLAFVQAPLGEREWAIASLAEGIAHRNALIWWRLAGDPLLSEVQSDPRVGELARRIVPA
jgi:tetratricopeptide (TPR) repeat protein